MKRLAACLPVAAMIAMAGCQGPNQNTSAGHTSADTPAFQIGIPAGNDTMKPEQTEYYSPVPPQVTPGATSGAPPSDAILLFDGKDLNNWVSANDTTKPAEWTVANNTFTVNPGKGNIQTKERFMDYQLHVEWMEPVEDTAKFKGQDYGNSGVFLASLGKGDAGYELQVLNSYNGHTYVDGQAGSLYKQFPPLVNATRPAGQWQTYDIIWKAPRFNPDSSLVSPASTTVLLNGVLIQNHSVLKGVTLYIGHPYYRMHGASPIKLQDHHHKVSYRNIWVRPL